MEPQIGLNQAPTHDDIYRRLASGQERFAQMEDKLDQIIRAQADMASQLAEVKETADATKGVVEAWDTARNFAKFTKWVAGVIAAVSAIVVAVKLAASELTR